MTILSLLMKVIRHSSVSRGGMSFVFSWKILTLKGLLALYSVQMPEPLDTNYACEILNPMHLISVCFVSTVMLCVNSLTD